MSNQDDKRRAIAAHKQAMRSLALEWRAWVAQGNQGNADFALRRAIAWRDACAKISR